MSALRILGYVIVSADGMLADANGVMPDALKIPGDQAFFNAAMDHVDLIVHGRNSFEDQPRSPQRNRIILSSHTDAVSADPDNARATLWNPDGASFDEALGAAGVQSGTIAVIGGPSVFEMFFDRFDTFWLSQAPRVQIPNGTPAFPGVPAHSPEEILAAHGLTAGPAELIDAAHNVTVTPWQRLG